MENTDMKTNKATEWNRRVTGKWFEMAVCETVDAGQPNWLC